MTPNDLPQPSVVRRAINHAAAAALGGPPARPPAMPTQLVGPSSAPEAGDLAGAQDRAAFTAAHMPPPAPAGIGNPTFDRIPPEVSARRGKVASCRRILAELITRIQSDSAGLMPILEDLADDSQDLKAAELFDPAAASKFLADLNAVITGLTPASGKRNAEIEKKKS